ncbi:MAG: asparagine synthase (glutamine-hydrolyzing), partial [Ignavibacteria bacterium]|nr:asparagine synthase (glutamine-hydrolyzing) [Ignavibacteria bacterium]
MCGINGILYFNGTESDRPDEFHFSNIRKMNRAISHRGPDGEGVFIDYPVCLGHRRLSIIDLSDAGSQPMFNEDRSLALIYNGEIYNYKELLPDLISKGHRFSSKTDSEVVLHAYEEYGEDCVKLFNGMWAFAICDIRRQRIFASRDRFGVKPFFYYIDNSRFIFSSECKAILSCVPVTAANRRKVFSYLAYGYRLNDGESFFEGIKELLPAHNLTAEQGCVTVSRYWDLPGGIPEKEAGASHVRDLLFDSVALRFRSDVPVSVLLSGGIDSGIIAAVTNELVSTGMISNFSVSSYSAVFPGYEHDESEKIKDILRAC